MPYRKTLLVTGEFYHILNRGVAQAPIFLRTTDYRRALELIDYYRFPNTPLRFSYFTRLNEALKTTLWKDLTGNTVAQVDILVFCLMPNHVHFLLGQRQEKGISKFMSNFQNSYARYFNTKYQRSGALFQALFKAIRVETEEQLLHLSRYIHLNPTSAHLVEIENLETYYWSSLPEYLGRRALSFVNYQLILDYFKDRDAYRKFVFDQANYQRKLEKVKHLTLE